MVFANHMVLQLFLKSEVSRHDGYGMGTIRQPSKISAHYLRTWSFIDLISIVPTDSVILLLEGIPALRQQMKILRFMRIFKLVKLLRVLKAWSVLQRWQIYTVLWLNNKAYTPDNPCFSLHIFRLPSAGAR